MPRLCVFYPGICFTTEEKARQTSVTVAEAHRHQLSGIKIFNNLPSEIKNVAGDQKSSKQLSKKILYTFSFYTMEENLSES